MLAETRSRTQRLGYCFANVCTPDIRQYPTFYPICVHYHLSGEIQATCSIKEWLSAVLILNQIEYIAGKNTSVRIVPAKVPPISV